MVGADAGERERGKKKSGLQSRYGGEYSVVVAVAEGKGELCSPSVRAAITRADEGGTVVSGRRQYFFHFSRNGITISHRCTTMHVYEDGV